jgi:hypothetical protein
MEDTVMGWLGIGSGGSTAVASQKVNAPNIVLAQLTPSADMPALGADTMTASATINSPDIAALASSLSARGLDAVTASRALDAYRRTISSVMQPPVLATIN